MKIKTCVPHTLPLRSLNWDCFADLIGKAHAAVAKYEEALKQAKNSQDAFSILMAQESIASVESKKIRVSLKEVLRASKEAGDRDDLVKVLNYRSALLKGAQMMMTRPLSGIFLRELHSTISKDAPIARKDIGRWRDRQNWIGPEGCGREEAYFFPPNLAVMRRRMDNLFRYLRYKDKDPLVQLAIAFAQLLIIHPFMDGNGRVGRAMIPLFLYKKKVTSSPIVYLSAYFKKHRLEYFEKLFSITSDKQWEEWIRFFLKGVIEECESNMEKISRM